MGGQLSPSFVFSLSLSSPTQIELLKQGLVTRYFLELHSTNVDVHNTHAYSSLWIYVRKLYPYEHLRKTKPAYLEIHEIWKTGELTTRFFPHKTNNPWILED
jgi:hypothetical protein